MKRNHPTYMRGGVAVHYVKLDKYTICCSSTYYPLFMLLDLLFIKTSLRQTTYRSRKSKQPWDSQSLWNSRKLSDSLKNFAGQKKKLPDREKQGVSTVENFVHCYWYKLHVEVCYIHCLYSICSRFLGCKEIKKREKIETCSKTSNWWYYKNPTFARRRLYYPAYVWRKVVIFLQVFQNLFEYLNNYTHSRATVCLCWGFTAQSTQWGHVEHSQFT